MANKEFDESTVKKVADLARLELSADEIRKYTAQLGDILEYIKKLSEVDTSKVEPMTTPLSIETPLREDAVRPSVGAATMLESAPEQLYDNYKVPQVLGG